MTQDLIKQRASAAETEPDAHGQAALLLTESLLHMLVENKRLTNAQAVDVIHTASVVKAEGAGESKSRINESLALLARMENSFQADEPERSV